MKLFFILTIIFFLNLPNLIAQNFINGSFENTSSTNCDWNNTNIKFNSKMPNVYAFGTDNEVDILRKNCALDSIPDGNVALAISNFDAIAIELSSPLTSENSYKVTFKAFGNTTYEFNLNNLSIGCSLTNDDTDTAIYTANAIADTWTEFSFDFIASKNYKYITVSGSGINGWSNIDDFVIEPSYVSTNVIKYDTKIKIYPNLSSEFIQFSCLTTKENFKIYNILGSEVKSGIISNQEKIDIRNLPKGLYFLKFENGNTIKFMKE